VVGGGARVVHARASEVGGAAARARVEFENTDRLSQNGKCVTVETWVSLGDLVTVTTDFLLSSMIK